MLSSSPKKATQPKAIDKFDDDLSRAIVEAKATAHLPLEEDEDAESPAASGIEDVDRISLISSRKHQPYVKRSPSTKTYSSVWIRVLKAIRP